MSERVVPKSFFWDNPVGRFLAAQVPWFRERWVFWMHKGILEKMMLELENAKEDVLVAASLFVSYPDLELGQGEVETAVCRYRNALLNIERFQHGDEVAREVERRLGWTLKPGQCFECGAFHDFYPSGCPLVLGGAKRMGNYGPS